MLRDRGWKLKYTPEDGDLVAGFYVPALLEAVRYDRLTGFFNAAALALAARGIEGLVRNGGRMRLLVGCTLDQREIDAIARGEDLRERVGERFAATPLKPLDAAAGDALELLAWMVAEGHLDVKVAVPCDERGQPTPDDGLFHEKAGIVEDADRNRLAWNGSLNETEAGWRRNWESINVYASWGAESKRVAHEDENFARLWANRSRYVIVLNIPEAARRDLLRFLPEDDLPARLKKWQRSKPDPPLPVVDRRNLVWSFIAKAPALEEGGSLVGEATAAVASWPHQLRAFGRLYERWPPKLLVADEVGLGKTIQAGLLLRQAWLAGRAKRILILAPKAVLRQWQIELREKFNLNWPIYDGRRMIRYPSPALNGRHESDAAAWHREPVVIASSHLMRRRDRAAALLEDAEPWDLVVLDEAHHARRRGAGTASEGGPNALLKLMRDLRRRTSGLILLTATPMQVHPVELWDLLDLFGLPPEWTADAFLRFFDDLERSEPEALDRMARLFRAVEREWGEATRDEVSRLGRLSSLKAGKVLRALRDESSIPRRQLAPAERRAAVAVARSHTPIRHLVSRHTRELLRRYFRAGMLTAQIAEREVKDRFVDMTAAEKALYEAVEDYIATAYDKAAADERAAVGFVMTVYRRRLASSLRALRITLERHLEAVEGSVLASADLDEDVPDDEIADDIPDAEELARMERRALAVEERADIERLLAAVAACPPDSKLAALDEILRALREDGCEQAMVFTQYADTMDFLRDALPGKVMCFSGRGGEIPTGDGAWRRIGRDDAKRRFRDREAEVLLCTDAAAEGLNFQFCGALVNYDMPWNPMRAEQRIGRIDRVGQEHPVIRIVNLHYEDTVETDVYRALRGRIGLFETVVGPLQPILARVAGEISGAVLAGDSARAKEATDRRIENADSLDIDSMLDEDHVMPESVAPPLSMDDLDRVIASLDLMPPDIDVRPLGRREYSLLAPGMKERLRVTTDPAYYEEHAESVELWSPGNPLFEPPEHSTTELPPAATLKEILDR